MKRSVLFLCLAFLHSTNLIADEFVAKRATYEKDGEKIELKDISGIPVFHADFYPSDRMVKIKCSAGTLILKEGLFFYGYSGKHKGLTINARAYIENGKIDQIVYEELDEVNNMKATIDYFRK